MPDPADLASPRAKWQHKQGCVYVPVFGDFYGDPDHGYQHLWSVLDLPSLTRRNAWSQGCRIQGSDDFNIAVVYHNRVIALLCDDEDMAEQQSVLDELTDIIVRPANGS